MRILVFVDHDIIVRHFVNSHVFDELARRHQVSLVLPEAGNKRIKTTITPEKLGALTMLRLPVSQGRLRLWQGLMLADMLRWRPGVHYAAMRRFHRHASGRRAALLYGFLAWPGVHQIYRIWVQWRLARERYTELERLLDAEAPDLLIHPTVLNGVYINDLVMASRQRQCPLVMIMNSWDNPSTKRAMSGCPDWLLVWGPQTHEHARRFLGMPAERTICFGAAQFDVYREPPRVSRDEFCRAHQIDPAAKILLYAGSSKGTDEFSHLCQIDAAIESGTLPGTVAVYRPHPWGGGGKGGERILKHPWRNVRIENTMRAYLEQIQYGSPGITIPDYRDTHDLLCAVDMLVSPLSTILIEGALHGKPVLCFLPDDNRNDTHFDLTLPLIHFDDLFASPSFMVAHGGAALMPMLQSLSEKVGDEQFRVALQAACTHFVSNFDHSYAVRLLEFVDLICEPSTS